MKLQQHVMVTVTEVDVTRKRIALTMKGQPGASGGAAASGERKKPAIGNTGGNNKNAGKKETPANNPFAAKLMELKKKFND